MERWIWGGSKIRMAVGYGAPLAFLTWLVGGSELSIPSLVGSLVGGGVAGALVPAALMGRSPHLAALDPADRVVVLDAVRGGDMVSDPRLAKAVVERTEVLGRAARTSRRDQACGGLLVVGVLVWAIVVTRDGFDPGDLWLWVLLAFGGAGTILGPPLRAKRWANAERAERYAREALEAA
ncbi:MAG TPA: hypothetical protein VGJ86_19905 [Acidimicrobiales bacterium]|jgi:hypothetical protein